MERDGERRGRGDERRTALSPEEQEKTIFEYARNICRRVRTRGGWSSFSVHRTICPGVQPEWLVSEEYEQRRGRETRLFFKGGCEHSGQENQSISLL